MKKDKNLNKNYVSSGSGTLTKSYKERRRNDRRLILVYKN